MILILLLILILPQPHQRLVWRWQAVE